MSGWGKQCIRFKDIVNFQINDCKKKKKNGGGGVCGGGVTEKGGGGGND